jgi:hypothetical protein
MCCGSCWRPEAIKNLLGPAMVQAASHHLSRVHRRFDATGFKDPAPMAQLPEASLKCVPPLRFDHDTERR